MKRIELGEEEVEYLKEFTKKGQKSARALKEPMFCFWFIKEKRKRQ